MNRKTYLLAVFIAAAAFSLAGCKKDNEDSLIALDTYASLWLGGWDSAYGSGLDIDNGTVYGYGSLSGARRYVDIFFDRSTLFSYDANGDALPDVGTRFASTSFTPEQFNAMADDGQFRSLEPPAAADSVKFKVNDVILFRTRWGKKGLILIKSLSSPTGDLNCEVKAQEK